MTKMEVNDLDCIIATIDQSPASNFQVFLSKLIELLESSYNVTPNAMIIITGDLNCNLLESSKA
jgi:hypothetical protein